MTDLEIFPQDSETAVLAIVLKDPSLIYNIEGLKSFMFSSITNQRLFDTMLSLAESNLLPDINLIISSLSSSGKLEIVGGTEYLKYLLNQGHNKDNFKEYIKIVKDSYKTRSLLSLSSSVSMDMIKERGVDTIIDNFRSSLDNITNVSGGNTTVKIGSILEDSYSDLVKRTNNPGIRGVTTGLSKVDLITGGFCSGNFWIISGRPSQGKTAIICNSILAEGKLNIPTLIFSNEMNKKSLVERFLSIDSGIPLTEIRLGILTKPQLELIKAKLDSFKDFPIFIDDSFICDPFYLESTIKKYHSLYGIKVVYIDYIQLLSEREENQTHELGRISRMCKKVAERLDGLCVVALSQLNREVEHRENKRPFLSDLRQSGNLEEDADVVVGLYRDEYYNKDTKLKGIMEYILLKQRNGAVGTISLGFVPETITIRSE